MFSNQVMVCPNPDSCTYTSRQQQLQQLQVDVRNIYYALQFQISLGTQSDEDSYMELETRTSYFADTRDPVMVDSNRAAMVVTRIFLSYLQVVSLLQFPKLFPESLNSYVAFYSLITDAVPFVSLDCSMPDYSGTSKAFVRTLVAVLSLAYITAVCWAGWLVWTVSLYICARRGGRSTRGINAQLPFFHATFAHMTHVFTLTVVVVTFFFYPSCVKALLSIFDCEAVGHNAPSNPLMERAGVGHGLYWRQNYEQHCYEGEHSTLVWFLGIPGLVLLALGWPAFCAVWLYRHMDRLYMDRHFTELYSFVFEGFKPQYGWWESVITVRKLAVAALVVFLHVLENKGLQLLVR
ncbi:MAG: hypothetical protein WDW38_004656 [Sanguina aurantia]